MSLLLILILTISCSESKKIYVSPPDVESFFFPVGKTIFRIGGTYADEVNKIRKCDIELEIDGFALSAIQPPFDERIYIEAKGPYLYSLRFSYNGKKNDIIERIFGLLRSHRLYGETESTFDSDILHMRNSIVDILINSYEVEIKAVQLIDIEYDYNKKCFFYYEK